MRDRARGGEEDKGGKQREKQRETKREIVCKRKNQKEKKEMATYS